ncbi:MAG: phosphatidylserine decarboxylase [Candidatus Methylomirabilales bacterium]
MVYKHLQTLSPLSTGRRGSKFPVAAEGWPFILPLLVGGLLLFILGLKGAGLFVALGGGAVGLFFRDPERFPPAEAGAILAPADGRVVRIGPSVDGRRGTEVSIFLSLFDVHINRAPCAGRVEEVQYSPGVFKVAWKEEASRVNEQTLIYLKGDQGNVFVRQVAGTLARRIVTWVQPGHEVQAGERIGMIRFGSRVDLLLPETVRPRVQIGDQVRGGESIIGVVS